MTTRITIDAHAGWPVLVVLKYGEPGRAKIITTERVEPLTVREFYVHAGCQIIGIEEQLQAYAANYEAAHQQLDKDLSA